MISGERSIGSVLKRLDAYPKTDEECVDRTFSGAAVTLIAALLMGVLFLSELYEFLSPKVTEDLFVDTTRGSKLKINFDVIFPAIPCKLLSLDAMDLSGEQHINIQHNLYKRRLDIEGSPLEDPERQTEIGHGVAEVANGTAVESSTEKSSCGSCYGAEYEEHKCCNSCDDVKDAYRRRGWAVPPLSGIEQCVKEGVTKETSDIPKEGCQIFGYLEVNRVGGNFHIAPGKSFQQSHIHVHDVQQYRTSDFDLSHQIRHLSFGINIPGKTNPIDGMIYTTEKGPKNINYYMKIVPTTYQRKDGSTLTTNQFSMTQHEKKLELIFGTGGLPGVFFNYELSPMMVKYTEESRSVGHFITGLCAIMGGVFTVAGLIDGMIYHSTKAFQKKVSLGKVG